MKPSELIGWLGLKVKDRVTGITGIATSASVDLYGCFQILVNPGIDENGKLKELMWFDTGRLVKLNKKPVITPPNFEEEKGPEIKPVLR